jgi:hypothetical protein
VYLPTHCPPSVFHVFCRNDKTLFTCTFNIYVLYFFPLSSHCVCNLIPFVGQVLFLLFSQSLLISIFSSYQRLEVSVVFYSCSGLFCAVHKGLVHSERQAAWICPSRSFRVTSQDHLRVDESCSRVIGTFYFLKPCQSVTCTMC